MRLRPDRPIGPHPLAAPADSLKELTRERVRQVETRGIFHMRVLADDDLARDAEDLDD